MTRRRLARRACAEWIVKDRGGRSCYRRWRLRVTSGFDGGQAWKRVACRVGQRVRRFASIAAGGCSWVMCGVWAIFNMARVFYFLTLLPRRRAPGLGSCFFCLASFGRIDDRLTWGRFWSTRIAFCQYQCGWRGGSWSTDESFCQYRSGRLCLCRSREVSAGDGGVVNMRRLCQAIGVGTLTEGTHVP